MIYSVLIVSTKPRNLACTTPRGRFYDLIAFRLRKTSRLHLPRSRSCLQHVLINLFGWSFVKGAAHFSPGLPISRLCNSKGARWYSDVHPDGYTGGCFRFRDVQYYALLADYQNKATTVWCLRRDINLTTNNSPPILPYVISSMLLCVFVSIISDWMQNLSRAEHGNNI